MHIVAITGNYIPLMKPPVRCLSPYLEELSKDNDVEVVCPVYSRRYTEDCTVGGIKINFVDSINNTILSFVQTNREENRYKCLTELLNLFYRANRYIKSYIRKESYESDLIAPIFDRLEKIAHKKNIDVLISVSFPFYNHIVALEFKKRHPETRWISFTTDPISYNETNPLPSAKVSLARKQEKEVYEASDICVCTEELYTNLIDDFHIRPTKVMSLPFLLTPFDNHESSRDGKSENGIVNVLYAGYVYYKIRNPKLMIDVFSRIDGVNLNLYVRGDRSCRKYFSELKLDNVHINDMVSRDSYIQLLNKSDVLINLSNTVRLQAPSKLLELVSTGKPVINFFHHQDTGYHIIEKYPLGVNISNSSTLENIISTVTRFINTNKGKSVSLEELEQLYPEHLFENQKYKFQFAVYNK